MQAVDRVRHLDQIAWAVVGLHFQLNQAGVAVLQDQRAALQFYAFERAAVVDGAQGLPVILSGQCRVADKQPEVFALAVATNHKALFAVVGVVLVAAATGCEALQRCRWIIRWQVLQLAGVLAAAGHADIAVRAAAVYIQIEQRVVFFKYPYRVGILTQAPECGWAGAGIQADGKQRAVVVGPAQGAGSLLQRQAVLLLVCQAAYKQLIHLVALGIEAVGQPVLVRADAEIAQLKKRVLLGQLVRVQQ